ncbi:MAG: FG-GAP repeat domain-containing protein [Gammaproteobacteria bacterium]
MSFQFRLSVRAALAVALINMTSGVLAAPAPFDVQSLALEGRVVTADFGDFNGDQRTDLMITTLEGLPPAETRTLHIYLRGDAKTFASTPSHRIRLPSGSAVYDIADVEDTPGDELILLRSAGLSVMSLATAQGDVRDMAVTGPSTIAAAQDERGFDRFAIAHADIGGRSRLLVPQLGALAILELDGTQVAQLEVGGRANYYVTKPDSLVAVESDIQLFLDVPKISVGDVDGNGLRDVVSATRHELRVFLSDERGQFDGAPDRILPLQLVDERDHRRGSGGVVVSGGDHNNDGLMDLMITHVEGSFTDSITTTRLYRNQGDGWQLETPTDTFDSKGAVSSDVLVDIDGDDTLELMRIRIKFSVLEIVEMLLTREVDAVISLHRLNDDGRYETKPWSRRKVSTGISFETFRPNGFMPRGGVDLNADGLMDFVASDNGKGIEVYLGGDKGPFQKRRARQKLPTAGVIRFEDIDGDGLPDFVLFDSQSFEPVVRIGRNTGALSAPQRQ